MYKDISASEAASRLNQHIKTAQDFLDGLANLGIVEKKEVFEKKRPYFRYKLIKKKIELEFNLESLYDVPRGNIKLNQNIREQKNVGAMFTTAGSNPIISSITIWIGGGREKKERKINLTTTQGKFLYYMPFPNTQFLSILEIIKKAGLNTKQSAEVLDIVELLIELDVIETETLSQK